MCAISGIFNKEEDSQEDLQHINAMIGIQSHRGPDAKGAWTCFDGRIKLGHNRLSIIDPDTTSNQPMISSDGAYAIVFNGEIYNYLQLKEELSSKGVKFRTKSDTEVLMEGYRTWGKHVLDKLRGMFAFAIYDIRKKELFCARDRIGKKPFVYAQTRDAFIFASEIPAILQVPGVDKSLDFDALGSIFLHNLRHIPDPHTAYKSIKRLRAGHALLCRDGQIQSIWRYWTPHPASGITTPSRLREIIEESISIRMRADVPVGALLSGGVDSSAIVALMQRHSEVPTHTYALGLNSQDEDLRRARVMAKIIGTSHREFYFNPDEQWKILNSLIRIYGEPIMLLPLVHTYALCRAIRDDGVKVVLTGHGADELFYGYTGHIRTLKVSRWLDRLSSFMSLLHPLEHTKFKWVTAKPGKRKAAFYESLSKAEWSASLTRDAINQLANRAAEEMEYWGQICPSEQFIDESNFVGLMVENTHSVTIAGDLPAMAAGVEIRCPFLDQEIVAFALGVPVEKKIPDTRNPTWLKAILRESVKDLIPNELLTAPKRGFGMEIQEDRLLRGAWRARVGDIFNGIDDIDGFLDSNAVKSLWNSFILNKKQAAGQLSKVLSLQIWLQNAGVYANQ